MITKNRRGLSWVRLMLLAILIHVANPLAGAEREPGASAIEPTMGRLVLEGEAIESLILEKRSDYNNPVHLRHPSPGVVIPVGEYRVSEVKLQGGYSCHPPGYIGDSDTDEVREVGWFTVGTDKPYVLRIGAPLKPTLKVIRENRTLRMVYSLLDVSEQKHWVYVPESFGSEQMADFTVYRGDQLVGSSILAPGG